MSFNAAAWSLAIAVPALDDLEKVNYKSPLLKDSCQFNFNLDLSINMNFAFIFGFISFGIIENVSSAPGGSSLGGVYAMKRAGDESEYAFDFGESDFNTDYQEFGDGDGTFEERGAVDGDFSNYGDYAYSIPHYGASYDYYN